MKTKDKIIKISRNKLNQLENLINNDHNLEQNSIKNLPFFKNKDTVSFPNIYSNTNIITPIQKRNINVENLVNINMRKINKIFISNNLKDKNTNIKGSNEFNKSDAISKISRRNFSNRKPTNKLLEAFSRSSTSNLELSKLNSSKNEKSLINNIPMKNISYLKNCNNKNLLDFENFRKKYDNSNINNKSNLNAFSKISSNINTNITTQRKTLNKGYLKTDINNNLNINFFKDINIKLLLLNNNNSNKKLPIKCRDNNSTENLSNLSEKNIIKYNKNKKEENNTKTIKLINRNKISHFIKQNFEYLNKSEEQNIKKKIIINSYDSYYLNEKKDFNCPEELHFYYIRTIQRGKINENRF